MEGEEKPQPADHRSEPAELGAADVPIYYNVTIFDEEDKEEEDDDDDDVAATKYWAAMEERDHVPRARNYRQNRAAAAAFESDEEMAHRLYMEELMAMEEWELREMDPDRPSSSSRAGVGAMTTAPGKFWASTPPFAQDDATFESIQEAESGAEFLGSSRIPGPFEALANERIRNGAGTNTASGFMRPGPCDFATTRARARRTRTALSKDTAAGSSSTRQDLLADADSAVIFTGMEGGLARFTSPGPRDFATGPARRTVRSKYAAEGSSSTQRGPVSTFRRALLAGADSATFFPGLELEEEHDNSWYEPTADDYYDDDEKPEQAEMQSLTESLQSCHLLRSEPSGNPAAADEPGPSTRVPPLADHEVPTFDCGLCKDTLPVLDLFRELPCEHRFCAACMATYVQYRMRASKLPVACPDLECGVLLDPEKCKKAIDYETFGDWGARLVERAIPANRRAYCTNTAGCGLMVETSDVAKQVMARCPECGHALARKRGWRPIR